MKLEFPKFLTCQGFSLGNLLCCPASTTRKGLPASGSRLRLRLASLPEKSLGKSKIWETQA